MLDIIQKYVKDKYQDKMSIVNNLMFESDYILLELPILDTLDESITLTNENDTIYSANYIENLLVENEYKFKIILDDCENTSQKTYDWTLKLTNTWKPEQYRLWICWKQIVENPIKEEFIKNVTIILQGKIDPNIDLVNTVQEYQKHGHVFISIYKTELNNPLIRKICKLFPQVVIATNDFQKYQNELKELGKFANSHSNNCYYQIKTTKKVIDKVISKFIVKSRLDHYYGSLDVFIESTVEKNKMTVSSLFVRGVMGANICFKYHLSDILFCGYRDEIELIFKLAEQNYTIGCPEVVIWKPYLLYKAELENINLEILTKNEYADWMDEYFYVFCINNHKNYKIKIRNKIFTNVKCRDKNIIRIGKLASSKKYFLFGCDLQ